MDLQRGKKKKNISRNTSGLALSCFEAFFPPQQKKKKNIISGGGFLNCKSVQKSFLRSDSNNKRILLGKHCVEMCSNQKNNIEDFCDLGGWRKACTIAKFQLSFTEKLPARTTVAIRVSTFLEVWKRDVEWGSCEYGINNLLF